MAESATINLLPRRAFEITLIDGTVIKGQFSTWSLKRLCDKTKMSLKQIGEKLLDPSLGDVTEFLLCAVEYITRKEKRETFYSDIDACDWIDQIGGIQSDEFLSLFRHSSNDDIVKGEEKKTEP